ncbi:MAG: hypothetical protein KKF88_08845 [Alphaproteobacteria bacterium]|nr:hypothetical protein [Alphaproteobacteria bacterium]
MAERITAQSDALASLWPGYWPQQQPFILYAPDTGAVFGGAASPQGITYQPGALAGANFGFVMDFPSGVDNTIMLEVTGPDDDLSTLFHEQFHDFQDDRFVWRGEGGSEYVDLSLIDDLHAFTFGVELERRVLAEILAAPDRPTRREMARVYLALRRDRERAMAPSVVITERHREWTEGTAQYAGLQASLLVAGHPPSQIREELTDGLNEDLLSRQGDFAINMFRWRAYSTGASLAWLLDDLGVPEWRATIESGTPLDVALEQAIGLAGPDEVIAARASYDDAEISLAIAPAVEAALSTRLDRESFLALAPARLVIELSLPPSEQAAVQISFQAPAMTPLGSSSLALPDAVLVSAEYGAFGLRVEDHSVLMEVPPSRDPGLIMRRFIILLPNLSGLGTLAPGPLLEPLEVEIEGITLTIPIGAVVEMDDASVTIRVQ